MAKPGRTGLIRIYDATIYSLKGLQAAWRHEAAFRQELSLMLLMTPLAFLLGQTGTQTALLLMSCFVVIIVELLNSAVEAVVDRVGAELHELSGRAKDMGSAAVFLSLSQVVVVWSLVAWQRFFG